MENERAVRRSFRALVRAVDSEHIPAVIELAERIAPRADLCGILRSRRPKRVGETVQEWMDSFGWNTEDGTPPDDEDRVEHVESIARATRDAIDEAVDAFDRRDPAGVLEALCEASRIEDEAGGTPSTDKAVKALLRQGWAVYCDGPEFRG